MADPEGLPADPLLLLPLRIEYRVVEEGQQLVVGALDPRLRRDRDRARDSRGPVTVSALGDKSPLRLQPATIGRREIWFRWLPDEPFSHEGVEPATAEERAALSAFVGSLPPGADWFDETNPAVAAAWQTFTAAVGVHRGVHLVRTGGDHADEDLATAAGRIIGLPRKIALFGLTGTALSLLGEGRPIEEELRYVPAALGAGDWITSFEAAVDAGMGVRVTEPSLVAAALEARWVIAVGVSDGDATGRLESYLRDAVANGNVELLEQDGPTNNSENAKTGYDPDPRDPVAALTRATYAERRRTPDPPTDAHVLATALGVDAKIVLQALGAGRDGVRHARSMATALLPGLVDILFSWLSETHLPREALIDFLADYAAARGPLPAVRLDTHPFGVLPIVEPVGARPPDAIGETQRRAFEFVHRLGSICVSALEEPASQQPVIEPGAPDNPERLARILRLNAVGKRIDVFEAGDESPKRRRIACPLVEGDDHRPRDYITLLQTTPLGDLPDPDETDRSTPLLFRLLRLALERTAARLPSSLGKLPLARMAEQAPSSVRPRLKALVGALDQLKGLSRDQLEVLMLEVVDLLHHRSDAWLTAVATARLAAQRRATPTGLRIGYYGILGRLRAASVTGTSDGYLQTPNVEKAITAALLRSAGRRHGGGGPFDFDLSSRRVRRALGMIALFREGLTPREVLGYRGERWLHDNGHDALIHELRARYPLPQGVGSTAVQERLMDGLALAEGGDEDLAGLPPDQMAAVGRLRAQLADDLDAVSDLTVAEAVHQMALGNNGAANAWINVLSGEPVPWSTPFVSTHRDGHGSTHRYSLVLDPRTVRTDNPREVAEPAVARLAARLIPGFGRCAVRVHVPSPDGGAPFRRDLRLRADLGMTPVDLVVGGRNEIVLRARHHVVRLWQTDSGVQAALGTLPAGDLITHVNQVQPISVDLAHGNPSPDELLALAQPIGGMIRESRALEALDLNAAGPPDGRLTEADMVAVLRWTIGSLVDRAETMSGALAAIVGHLQEALGEVRAASAELERLGDAAAPDAEIEATRQRLADARAALEAPLLASSRFGLPEALIPFTAAQLEAGGAANEHIRNLEAVLRRLADKQAGLDGAIVLAATVLTTRREAEQLRARLVSALKAACDGDGLAVLPPFRKQPQTAPALDEVPDIAAELRPYDRVRPKVRTVLWLLDHDPDQRAWRSTGTATADTDEDDSDDTVRSEAERPRSHHCGIYLGLRNGILGTGSATAYSGLVIDEWSELRTSMVQNTGMAVNYDSPQSEPPHVLLLGIASHSGHADWTGESAAALVQEAIRLMQTRALPAAAASRRETIGALFNVVAPAGSGARRIPTANYHLIPALDDLGRRLELIDAVPSRSRTVYGVVERRFGNRPIGPP